MRPCWCSSMLFRHWEPWCWTQRSCLPRRDHPAQSVAWVWTLLITLMIFTAFFNHDILSFGPENMLPRFVVRPRHRHMRAYSHPFGFCPAAASVRDPAGTLAEYRLASPGHDHSHGCHGARGRLHAVAAAHHARGCLWKLNTSPPRRHPDLDELRYRVEGDRVAHGHRTTIKITGEMSTPPRSGNIRRTGHNGAAVMRSRVR
jgi:hypothetical protein